MAQSTTVKIILDKRYKNETTDKHPVKIRVTHARKQKYYGTKYSMTQTDWEAMNERDNKGKKIRRPERLKDTWYDLRKIEERADDIAEKLSPFSFDMFGKKYLNKHDTKTLKGAFDAYIATLKNRPGTVSSYGCAIVSLEKYKPGLMVTDVTQGFLKDYSQWMEEKKRSTTTTGMYMRALRAVINSVIAAGDFDAELNPFGRGKFSPPQGSGGDKRVLTEHELYKVYHYTGPDEKAKDFWFFSYFANGINFKDICRLKYSDINKETNTLSRYRSKTIRTQKKPEKLSFEITEDMAAVIEKYGTGGSGDDFIFPILDKGVAPDSDREKQLKDQFIHVINQGLKEIAKDLKIKKFTTYAARHSWATLQRNENLPIAVISKLMGHNNIKTTESYLGGLSTKIIRAASKNSASFKQGAKVVSL